MEKFVRVLPIPRYEKGTQELQSAFDEGYTVKHIVKSSHEETSSPQQGMPGITRTIEVVDYILECRNTDSEKELISVIKLFLEDPSTIPLWKVEIASKALTKYSK